jgi:hypothetical protein
MYRFEEFLNLLYLGSVRSSSYFLVSKINEYINLFF